MYNFQMRMRLPLINDLQVQMQNFNTWVNKYDPLHLYIKIS